ncbi:hypothetical protein HP439_12070 [Sphingobacterium shayense]|uniref:YobI family P-loop NTPase n=1 Tax=Sphingobacterium shayense TaxID=626343 RepID=UPI001557473F|nr:hypothetical protein [Sphingobacterium shayense]NQD71460.1 hypothetical protein [Sphingobacterium shayense]
MHLKSKYEPRLDNSNYSSLAPIADADKDNHYTNALTWALQTRSENDIRNITLTGPYGSGKSSVLKTFQNKYVKNDLHFLNISLATFKEEVLEEEDELDVRREPTENIQTTNGPIVSLVLHKGDVKKKTNSESLIRLIELKYSTTNLLPC